MHWKPSGSGPRWTPMWLAAMTLASGCATGGAAPRAECAGWRPIYVGDADVLTVETAAGILAHNEQGAARGCW